MALPKDAVILLSYVNTQLRDFYPTLEEFCKVNDADEEMITEKLKAIGYEYDREQNRFR